MNKKRLLSSSVRSNKLFPFSLAYLDNPAKFIFTLGKSCGITGFPVLFKELISF